MSNAPANKSNEQVSKTSSTPAFLPVVSDEEAQSAREQVAQRKFVPSGNRPPDEVLPNPKFIQILDQGQEGASVGMALAAVLNFLRAEGGEHVQTSPRMLYEYARVYDEWPGTDYEGTSLLGGIASLIRHGAYLEREWPPSDPYPRPGSPALQLAPRSPPASVLRVDKNIEHLRAAVFEHHALAVSAGIHDGWDSPRNGVIGFEEKRHGKDRSYGGHAFAVVGYTSRGFIVQNSWGTAWGGVKVGSRTLGGLGIWTYEDAEENLSDAWVIQLSRSVYRTPLVGYDADSLDGDDLLEIKAEVSAFSYVLASHAIRPPLAVGLFGDWGSGKSFFMKEMQAKIASLAGLQTKQPKQSETQMAFCRQIVQIKFNAWHYGQGPLGQSGNRDL